MAVVNVTGCPAVALVLSMLAVSSIWPSTHTGWAPVVGVVGDAVVTVVAGAAVVRGPLVVVVRLAAVVVGEEVDGGVVVAVPGGASVVEGGSVSTVVVTGGSPLAAVGRPSPSSSWSATDTSPATASTAAATPSAPTLFAAIGITPSKTRTAERGRQPPIWNVPSPMYGAASVQAATTV
jgi:hypothetical protein